MNTGENINQGTTENDPGWDALIGAVPFAGGGISESLRAAESESSNRELPEIKGNYGLTEDRIVELDRLGTWKTVGQGEHSIQIALKRNDGSLSLITESDYLDLTKNSDSPYSAENNAVLAKNPSLNSAFRNLSLSVAKVDCKLGHLDELEASFYTSTLRALNKYERSGRGSFEENALIEQFKADLARQGSAFAHLSKYAEKIEQDPKANIFTKIEPPKTAEESATAELPSPKTRDELMAEATKLNQELEGILAKLRVDLKTSKKLLKQGRETEPTLDKASEQDAMDIEKRRKEAKLRDELAAIDTDISRKRQELEEIERGTFASRRHAEEAIAAEDFKTAQSYVLAYMNGMGDYEVRARLFANLIGVRDGMAIEIKNVLGEADLSTFMTKQHALSDEAKNLTDQAIRKRNEVMEDADRLMNSIVQASLAAGARNLSSHLFN